MMFGSDGPASTPRRKWKRMTGQRRQREGSTSTADARAFLRWAQTHTTSVSIVSMQDSNAATSATGGPGASGPRGEQQGTDRMTKTRVSSSAAAPPLPPSRTSSTFFSSLIWSRDGGDAKASAIGGLSPTHFLLLPRHRMPACVPLSRHRQSSDLRACTRDPSFKPAYISTYGLSSFLHMRLSRPFSISMLYTS
ncbi:hypothetical protein BGY98DRAFT_1192424 [Russula aff. rugulosa BPL654]|nr:hypothetical protein BGY98DRAFT_1192424 [Russula aff. rugulosa BPL654]